MVGFNENRVRTKNSAMKRQAAANGKGVAVNPAKKPDETFRELKELEYEMHHPWKYRITLLADYFVGMFGCLISLNRFVMLGLIMIAVILCLGIK